MDGPKLSRGRDGNDWVRGWEIPLKHHIARAVASEKKAPSWYREFARILMSDPIEALDAGKSGPEAFRILVRKLSSHYQSGDAAKAISLIRDFTVDKDTSFILYVQNLPH